jgi:hypothetical protein
MNRDPYFTHYIVMTATGCLHVTTADLLVLGADILTAIGFGYTGTFLGAVWGWLLTRRA